MKFIAKDEAPSLSIVGAMWLVAAWAWPRAADRIPVHFNVDFHADRFGGKAEGLLLLPAVATIIYAISVLRAAPQRSPAGLILLPAMWPRRPAPRIAVLGVFLLFYLLVVARAVR